MFNGYDWLWTIAFAVLGFEPQETLSILYCHTAKNIGQSITIDTSSATSRGLIARWNLRLISKWWPTVQLGIPSASSGSSTFIYRSTTPLSGKCLDCPNNGDYDGVNDKCSAAAKSWYIVQLTYCRRRGLHITPYFHLSYPYRSCLSVANFIFLRQQSLSSITQLMPTPFELALIYSKGPSSNVVIAVNPWSNKFVESIYASPAWSRPDMPMLAKGLNLPIKTFVLVSETYATATSIGTICNV